MSLKSIEFDMKKIKNDNLARPIRERYGVLKKQFMTMNEDFRNKKINVVNVHSYFISIMSIHLSLLLMDIDSNVTDYMTMLLNHINKLKDNIEHFNIIQMDNKINATQQLLPIETIKSSVDTSKILFVENMNDIDTSLIYDLKQQGDQIIQQKLTLIKQKVTDFFNSLYIKVHENSQDMKLMYAQLMEAMYKFNVFTDDFNIMYQTFISYFDVIKNKAKSIATSIVISVIRAQEKLEKTIHGMFKGNRHMVPFVSVDAILNELSDVEKSKNNSRFIFSNIERAILTIDDEMYNKILSEIKTLLRLYVSNSSDALKASLNVNISRLQEYNQLNKDISQLNKKMNMYNTSVYINNKASIVLDKLVELKEELEIEMHNAESLNENSEEFKTIMKRIDQLKSDIKETRTELDIETNDSTNDISVDKKLKLYNNMGYDMDKMMIKKKEFGFGQELRNEKVAIKTILNNIKAILIKTLTSFY